MPGGSYSASDIQDYIDYILKSAKYYPLTLIHIYINENNNGLVLTIKDGYKLDLKMIETMKLMTPQKN